MRRAPSFVTISRCGSAWPLAARDGNRMGASDGSARHVARETILQRTLTSPRSLSACGHGLTDGRNVRIDVRWYGSDDTTPVRSSVRA